MEKRRFFLIGNSFINADYVKDFKCDTERCAMTIANTSSSAHFDNVIWWNKGSSEYQDARRNWLVLARYHRQHVQNHSDDLLEKNADMIGTIKSE